MANFEFVAASTELDHLMSTAWLFVRIRNKSLRDQFEIKGPIFCCWSDYGAESRLYAGQQGAPGYVQIL